MGKETGISFTDHTWNPWEGCDRVSPGCANCYLFEQLKRNGRDPGKVRRTRTWKAPERWNEEANRAGRIDKVLTCSLSDFFHEGADAWRPEAWKVMRRCPHLHFQVLTRGPLRIRECLPADWGEGYPNVWLGVSIESSDYLWRADVLRQIPARVRWISAEPLLGPLPDLDLEDIQWIVLGGEYGPGYRNMDPAWAMQIRDRAKAQGVPFFFKQSAGARAGRGDLLEGRRWQELPSLAPKGKKTPRKPPRPEKEIRGKGKKPDSQKQQAQRKEINRLRAELKRHHQEAETLRAELERQRQEAEQVQSDLETRLAMEEGLSMEVDEFWQRRVEEALDRAQEAEWRYHELCQQVYGAGGSPHQFQGGAVPPQVQQDLSILGLQWPCTPEAIKTAYHAMAMKHHPDRGGDGAKFKEIKPAYERLQKEFGL